jgi:hypothetical protein
MRMTTAMMTPSAICADDTGAERMPVKMGFHLKAASTG